MGEEVSIDLVDHLFGVVGREGGAESVVVVRYKGVEEGTITKEESGAEEVGDSTRVAGLVSGFGEDVLEELPAAFGMKETQERLLLLTEDWSVLMVVRDESRGGPGDKNKREREKRETYGDSVCVFS